MTTTPQNITDAPEEAHGHAGMTPEAAQDIPEAATGPFMGTVETGTTESTEKGVSIPFPVPVHQTIPDPVRALVCQLLFFGEDLATATRAHDVRDCDAFNAHYQEEHREARFSLSTWRTRDNDEALDAARLFRLLPAEEQNRGSFALQDGWRRATGRMPDFYEPLAVFAGWLEEHLTGEDRVTICAKNGFTDAEYDRFGEAWATILAVHNESMARVQQEDENSATEA